MTELEIKQNSIQVLGTYYSTAANNTIAYAHQVKDNNLNKFQNTINQDLTDKIEDLVQENQTIRSLIDSINKFSIIVLEDEEELPEIGKENSIYLKKETNLEGNIYNEYLYVNSKWELIGNTSIDLSNYYTKSEVYNKNEVYTKSEVYNKTETYSKSEVNDKLSEAGAGDVIAESTFTSSGNIIVASNNNKTIKDSGIHITSLNNTWRPINVGENTLNDNSTVLTINGGDGISVELTDGDLEIINTKEDYVLPTASENSLGGVKISHVPVKDSELTVQLDAENKAFVNITSESISNALGYTPINDNSFPVAIPNPYSLVFKEAKETKYYNGSSSITVNIPSTSLEQTSSALPISTLQGGQLFRYIGSSSLSFTVTLSNFSLENSCAVFITPANLSFEFTSQSGTVKKGEDLVGTSDQIKAYAIQYIIGDVFLINSNIYK